MVRTDSVDLDAMYKIAANERRRTLVKMLMDREREMPIEEVCRRLLERESADVESVDDDAVLTELDHWHLPMLREAGFIEFDREPGVVRPRGELGSFDSILPDSD